MEHVNKFDKYNYKELNYKRGSGILMHISSLPGKYGIGTFGEEAYDFVDFLELAKQKYWQVLPLGPTGYGDSPYQSYSSFAGNPYFIDLESLEKDGLIENDYRFDDYGDPEKANYEKVALLKVEVLKDAFKRSRSRDLHGFTAFLEQEKYWLEDYALFMAIKEDQNGIPWYEWDENLKNREEDALNQKKQELKELIDYQYFIQFLFYRQYGKLKKYANEKGIKIIGDLPIYVAHDSCDAWKDTRIFQLDESLDLKYQGGCPPDSFSEDGQTWGNPVYNWDILKEENYVWWMERLGASLKLFDILRLDHFRGFESYWRIPAGEKSAKNGEWVQGPANDFFDKVKEVFPDREIIAEDLGYMTEEVTEMRKRTGYPGMKVLQFAFDVSEESEYLPHNVERNWVMYTGTHDNDTLGGWIENATEEEKEFARNYLKLTDDEGEVWGMIRGVWSSVADTAIAQMQDFLELGTGARMNVPGTIHHWTWRVRKEQLTKELASRIGNLTKLYSRFKEE